MGAQRTSDPAVRSPFWLLRDVSTASLRLAIRRGVIAERGRLELTQQQLADKIGWTRRIVGQIETGERSVRGEELADLCRALEVDLSRLLIAADIEDRRALGL
jgi:DNA-binding XRE family transcriptional regulator